MPKHIEKIQKMKDEIKHVNLHIYFLIFESYAFQNHCQINLYDG